MRLHSVGGHTIRVVSNKRNANEKVSSYHYAKPIKSNSTSTVIDNAEKSLSHV